MTEQEEDELTNQFYRLRWNWSKYWDSEPDRGIAILNQAIDIAEKLEKPRWVMECRHWIAQLLVFKKRNYTESLPMAVESIVEAQKPIYHGLTTRICLYQDLIASYVGVDAVSHAGSIEKALDSMQAEAPPNSQCALCLANERASFELRRNRFEASKKAANQVLNMTQGSHHRSTAFTKLIFMAFRDQEWEKMAKLAESTAKLIEGNPQRLDIFVEVQIWHAVALMHLGQPEKAAEMFQRGEAAKETSGGAFHVEYWDARVVYYELCDDLDQAILTRKSHLDAIDGLGALREEALAWIDLCRMQKSHGELDERVIANAKYSISKCQINDDLLSLLEASLEG